MEKVRRLKSGHSQSHQTPVEDDWDDWFEKDDVTDDLMLLSEKSGDPGE